MYVRTFYLSDTGTKITNLIFIGPGVLSLNTLLARSLQCFRRYIGSVRMECTDQGEGVKPRKP